MKTIKFYVVAALLAICSSANAQFTNASSSSSSTSISSEGWSSFFLQYNPSKVVSDADGAEDLSFTGITAGFSKAFAIAPSTPIYLEAGLAIQYSFATWNWKDDLKRGRIIDTKTGALAADPEEKFSMFSAKVPVSLTYVWDLPNSSISLAPFAGVDFRFNALGSMKTEKNMKSGYTIDDDDWEDNFGKIKKDVFDKKDMGDEDATFKRFQIGWHIGLNAYFNKQYYVGISYGSDFSEIRKKTKVNTTSITLGFCL